MCILYVAGSKCILFCSFMIFIRNKNLKVEKDPKSKVVLVLTQPCTRMTLPKRVLSLLKLKLFGVLSSIDIVVSVRRLFTETMMSIDYEKRNSLSLNMYQLPHFTQKSRNILFHITTFPILCLIFQRFNDLGLFQYM